MHGSIHNLLIETAHAVTTSVPVNLDPQTGNCNDLFRDGGFNAPGVGFRCWADFGANLSFVVIAFAASISLIMLIVNGFRYMVGPAIPGGSSDAAKKGIGAALAGLALCLLTYIILSTIISTITN